MMDVLHFVKTDPRAICPTRAHSFDAGLDLYALEDVLVEPGQVLKVDTGLKIALKSIEVGLICDKSGRAASGLTVLGGVIDGPYRGPLIVVVANVAIFNGEAVEVKYGKAIAQLLVIPNVRFPTPKELSEQEFAACFTSGGQRGEAGFGSTDKDQPSADLVKLKLEDKSGQIFELRTVFKQRIYFEGKIFQYDVASQRHVEKDLSEVSFGSSG